MSDSVGLAGRTVLVTGASGFLGSRTVNVLSDSGCNVHALVRRSSQVDHLCLPNVTIYRGDVADAESLVSAFKGAEYVIHAAADTAGTEEGGRLITIQGTKNVLAQCVACKVRKLVYISSCSVYGVTGYRSGQVVDENAPLEDFPERRGEYSRAKLEAEKLVTRFMIQGKIPTVCLRPGIIFGPGGAVYPPMMGLSFKNKLFAVIENREFALPLVYIDNLVSAIVGSLVNDTSAGQVYNVIDTDCVTKRRYMEKLIYHLYPHATYLYIPYRLVHLLVLLQEVVCTLLFRKPVLSRYRLSASQKPIRYDVSKIVRHLNWEPAVSFDEAVAKLINYETKHEDMSASCRSDSGTQ